MSTMMQKSNPRLKARGGRGRQETGDGHPSPSPEERQRLIRERAYYLAEQAGFSGDSVAYWLAAEQEVDGGQGQTGLPAGPTS